MVDKLAVMLIQREPGRRVLVDAVGQRFHLQRRQLQLVHELRRVLQRQVHIGIARKPMPPAPLQHPAFQLLRRHRARRHLAHQLAKDLAIQHLELVHRHQRAVVQDLQTFFNLQNTGALGRQHLKRLGMGAAVLPAADEHLGLLRQAGFEVRIHLREKAAFEQLNRKILQTRLAAAVAKAALHQLPKILVQPTTLQQLAARITPLGQLSQQGLQHLVQARLAASAHGHHLQAQGGRVVVRGEQRLEGVAALGRLKKRHMLLQQRIALRPQAQLGQPQRHLIGAKHRATGQLHIQQPVVQIFGLRACTKKQKLLRRLPAQHAVLHAKFVVSQFDLFYVGQIQRRKLGRKFLLRVVPKDDALLVKQLAQCLGDSLVFHSSPSNPLVDGRL